MTRGILVGSTLVLLLSSGCGGGSNGYVGTDKDRTPYVLKGAGDGQTVSVGQIAPVRCSVQLKMDLGQITNWNLYPVNVHAPTSGASGTFVDDGESNVAFGPGHLSARVLSGPDGLVTLPRFQANDTIGSYDVTVQVFNTFYADKPGSVTFRITNQ